MDNNICINCKYAYEKGTNDVHCKCQFRYSKVTKDFSCPRFERDIPEVPKENPALPMNLKEELDMINNKLVILSKKLDVIQDALCSITLTTRQ